MTDKIEPHTKFKIAWPDLDNVKITIEFCLLAKEWRGFIQSAEKTGGPIQRKIAELACEALVEVDKRKGKS